MSDHLKVELETIIALGIMTYIVETNLYELHPMDDQGFNDKLIYLAKSNLAIFSM